MPTAPKYEMTVDLNVLDHLGINLYSNIAAVLTEVVANAWDADAELVSIQIQPDGEWIEIADDGIGMNVADMNTKYLRVGYRRRDSSDEFGKVTGKGRLAMGRKGLGKLSLFSIASTIEIQSIRDGELHGLRMSVDGIHKAVSEKTSYHPEPLASQDVNVTKGTRIVLRDIKRQRLGKGVGALKKRLSRRFSVIGEVEKFRIEIDGAPITTADRGDLQKAQFLWKLGSPNLDDSTTDHVVEMQTLSSRQDGWDPSWSVTGWIGTARYPKDLDSDEAGNLNGLVVLARGRLIHENVLDKLNDGRLYTKYITGQIQADFLDLDASPDIATSDRQRIQEDDPRSIKLLDFLRVRLNEVEKQWNDWRGKHEVKRIRETSPQLAEWLDKLPAGFKKNAESLLLKLGALPVESDEDKKTLYRHGIFAFERMRLRGSTDELAQKVDNVEGLLRLLADRDALEASLYRDIVRSRLEAIANFQDLADEEAKEKVLQKYLFNHLWLLDAAWDRATGSAVMEDRLIDEGVVIADLTRKEELGRVDIAYRTSAGKHIVVELKKAERKLKLIELVQQGQLYVDKLRKILLHQGQADPNIEVVFVIGPPIDEESNNTVRLKDSMNSISPGSRIKHYDELIGGAQSAYQEYFEKTKELDRLEKLVGSI